jgi:hypothetical protein
MCRCKKNQALREKNSGVQVTFDLRSWEDEVEDEVEDERCGQCG